MNRRSFLGLVGAGMLGWRGPATGARLPWRWPGGLDGDVLVERWSWAMGQPVHLQLYASSEAAGYEVAQAVCAELRRVEAALSRFDDASELSELNRRAGRGALRVGADLARVLRAALDLEHRTGGAFDVAVEPLMRAWGFHAPRSVEPTTAEIAEARAEVRAAGITVRDRRVALRTSATQLDLGGIGVGYGLDRAAALLSAAGIRRALLDVSGDCIALEAPPGETGWQVGIAAPAPAGGVIGVARLRHAALATSSNLVSVVRYGKAVRGHVMDPANGWPASGCRQVSVLARTGTEADALSTAMLVAPRRFPGVLQAWLA